MSATARFVWEDPPLLEDQFAEGERMIRDATRGYCQCTLKRVPTGGAAAEVVCRRSKGQP